MRVEIWSDIACPWCYVGKRRFEQALARFEHPGAVEVVWRSFELDPNAPRGHGVPQDELLAAKYGVPLERARQMSARVASEAKKEGLDLHFDRVKVGNTFDAHRLVHLAGTTGKADAMKERLMKAYFTDGEAIGEPETLTRLAADVGLAAARVRDVLRSAAYAADVRADEGRARSFGISGVPFFAIDERYGVSGAQTPDVLLDALRQAHGESSPTVVAGDGDTCDDEGCTV
jgi:predicted DsbA family dithiol-disulfide isomerase